MEFPEFLEGIIAPAVYWRWLDHKATAHNKRDRARGRTCSRARYQSAIHDAVLASGGKDVYTGEQLHWHLISTYDNEASTVGKHAYKASFALLPTVDHVFADATSASFRICAWRTNDAKHDLSPDGFVALCLAVVEHAGFSVVKRGPS
jgi:4-hydroxyphenylpyruvate dioxygenase-like putative hemolysin